MRTTIHKLLFASLALLALTSCSAYLEENPTDRINEDEAYATASDVFLNGVAALYSNVGGFNDGYGLQGTGRGLYDLNTFTTDEAIIPTRGTDWYDGGLWQELFTHDWQGGNAPTGDTWRYLISTVMKCNKSLGHIKEYAQTHPADKELMDAYSDEVRALRALFYFYAMDLFGRVPILTSSETLNDDLQPKERSKVFEFIVSELQETAPRLSDAHSNFKGEFYGRVTQPVAYFVLAKLALNSVIYTDDNWLHEPLTDQQTNERGKAVEWNVDGISMNAWEATVAYCDKITALGYMLEEEFANNFIVNNDKSSENIFTIPMDKYLYTNQFVNLFRSRHYNHAAALGLNGENGPCATIEALEAFGYETAQQDPRFELTYYAGQVYDLNGNPVTLDDGTPLIYQPWKVGLDIGSTPWEKTAGARMAKYEVDPNGTKDGKQSDNDIVLFRYADVLLMKSEALVRDGKNGDEPLNEVRGRVFAGTATATLAFLLDERQRELAWEGWRRNDLVRFGRYTRAYTSRPQLPGEELGYTIVFPIPGNCLYGAAQNPGY